MAQPVAIGTERGIPVEFLLGVDRQQRSLAEPFGKPDLLRGYGRVEEVGMCDGGRVLAGGAIGRIDRARQRLGSGQERQAEDQRIALARQFAARGA
ncbi:MAG TPA: hypothetical protein DFK09_13355, partial [Erythrobacter sp.]|nr:hypothetical protein [Erythrobacter sp.]